MSLQVIPINDADLAWGFTDTMPSFGLKGGRFGRREKVDPFPCYPHDIALVTSEAERTASLFPVPFPVSVYVSAFEMEGRTNAHAFTEYDYDYDAKTADGEYPVKSGYGTIVISGKRIPIMPSMTRYLVSHEYGHLVEEALKKAKRLDVNEYAQMRGCEPRNAEFYGGRTWHKAFGEIFANDFRIIVCNREPEFWPHPVAHPNSDKALIEWWNAQAEQPLTQPKGSNGK
jgi:hypothetical protein